MFSRILKFFDTLRRTLGALVMLALIGLLGAALLSSRPSMPDSALLLLDPAGDIVEELEAQSGFPPDFSATGQTRLEDIVQVLRAAKQDKRISGLLLDFRDLDQVSLPALQTLGRELRDFRQGGKKISAYADQYSQTQYLAAANADELWLHPMGMVLLTGMSSYRNYFADALQRMHVDIHLFRAGSYKSAAEPLVRNDMSAAAREETQAVLDQLWAAIKQDISHARAIDPAKLQAMLDDPKAAISPYAGDPAALAKGMHLVDHIGTHGEWIQAIGEDTEQVGFSRYLHSLPPTDREGSGAKIGILTASGMITDGGLSAGGLHAEDFVELVDMAIEDDAIKAVVLRIDSPGGSVQASETMRRALSRLREAGKPLVVSMAGMAASGGYWIAAEADEIWTSPTTLTGSIGVFGVFPNMADALENLGIHSDGVGTTAIAGGMRPDRPLPQAVSDVLQAGVDHVYTTFTGIVARGRNLPADKVAQLAEGRVWTGADAVRLGLADQLGDLNDAIAAAAKRAGLEDDYGIRHVRIKQGLRERLIERFLGEANASLVKYAGGNDILGSTLTSGLHQASAWLHILQSKGGIYAISEFSPN